MANTRALTVQVSQQDVDNIIETLNQNIDITILPEIEQRHIKLQKIATDFLTVAFKTMDIILQSQTALELQKQSLKYVQEKEKFPVPQTVYKDLFNKARIKEIADSNFLIDFFTASLKFNEQLSELIYGKPLKTVIIIPGEVPQVYTYTADELVAAGSNVTIYRDFASKTHALVGRLRVSTTGLQTALQKQMESIPDDKDISIEGLNKAYVDALEDYRHHKGHQSKKNCKYVFFKDLLPAGSGSGRWLKMFIAGGEGDIAEAYASFLLLQTFNFRSGQWPNLTAYFINGVAQVDNKSGLYTADILGSNTNYAVKSLKASLPGYMQMLNLAQKIVLASKNPQTISWEQVDQIVNKYSEEANRQENLDTAVKSGLRNFVTEVTSKEFATYFGH